MATTPGYSGKPLYQKLGLKPGMTCLTMAAPDHYADLVDGVEGVTFSTRAKAADVVHLFCKDLKTLEAKAEPSLARVKEGGMLWVSWPKKSSPLYNNVSEDDLRRVILPNGWVDVKVCAVDNDWSGLKFLKRKS
ncbi:DUF3052 domain-containing protein [Parvularcula marina]|uniref:DUF3052 domain-containing protein n=1 Tax=Parvularcula marina TaxID=2292771 RepID=UPI003511BE71